MVNLEVRSRFGYLCVDGMRFRPEEHVDPETGEVFEGAEPVRPSHYKCPRSGVCMDVENRSVWVYPETVADEDSRPPTPKSEA